MARNLSFIPTPVLEVVNVAAIQSKPIREDRDFDDLKSSIQLMGVLQSVVLRATAKDYQIIGGARRVEACKQLGIETIPALVYPKGTNSSFVPTATITENAVRSSNIGSDVLAMQALVKDGERDPKVISEQTGLPKKKVQELFELIDLDDSIVLGIVKGTVAPTTAKEVKKLRPQAMQQAIDVLAETGKLTGKDIHVIRQVRTQAAADQVALPDIPELGELPEFELGKPWVTTDPWQKLDMIAKQDIVTILEADEDDRTKINRLRSLVGLEGSEASLNQQSANEPVPKKSRSVGTGTGTTIAQRSRNKKPAS